MDPMGIWSTLINKGFLHTAIVAFQRGVSGRWADFWVRCPMRGQHSLSSCLPEDHWSAADGGSWRIRGASNVFLHYVHNCHASTNRCFSFFRVSHRNSSRSQFRICSFADLVALLRSTGRQHLLRRASQIECRRLELWAFGGSRFWMLSQRPLLIAVASHHKDTVLDWFW